MDGKSESGTSLRLQLTESSESFWLHIKKYFITGRNEVVAKVMFLQVCVCPRGGGCLPQCMLGCQTPPDQAPPPGPGRHPPKTRQTPRTRQIPLDQADPPGPGRPPWTRQTPPGPGRPPPDQADPHPPGSRLQHSIRSTSGRYASYWNAFLFK